MPHREEYQRLTVTESETPLPWHLLTFPQAIQRALLELSDTAPRKCLAPYFDGRDGREVAESTISRWKTEPQRFPAHCLPVLVKLHEGFRSYVFQYLGAQMVMPSDVVRELSPAAGEEFRRVVERRVMRPLWPDVRQRKKRKR